MLSNPSIRHLVYRIRSIMQHILLGTYIIKSNANKTYIMEQEALLNYYPYAETRIGQYINGVKVATALPISTADYKYSIPYKKLVHCR